MQGCPVQSEHRDSGVPLQACGAACLERVQNYQNETMCVHRVAPSGESAELVGHCQIATKSSPAQTQLLQQTIKATGRPHAGGAAPLESEGKGRKYIPSCPAQYVSPSGNQHTRHHRCPLTTTSLPKPPHSLYRDHIFNIVRLLFHLTHRNTERQTKWADRRICPN